MTSNIKDNDLKRAYSFEKSLLLLSGFYPESDIKRWKILSAAFNLFVGYGLLFSMLIQITIDRHNLPKITEALLFVATHSTFLCKLMNFIYHKNIMLDIEETLSQKIFYGHPLKHVALLENKLEACHLMIRIYRIQVFFALLFYIIFPYLDNRKDKTFLPGWYPFNTTKHNFETSIFQSVSVCLSAYNNTTIDIMICLFFTLISGLFDILNENLKEIDYTQGGETAQNDFIGCVQYHKAIVRFAKQVESMFSKGIFVQFFASIMVICFTGFQMFVVPISGQLVFLVFYFTCMMFQIAMYCWFAHDIITSSDSIGAYFYLSNWYEADLKTKKSMTIFLERTKQPLILTAGKFIPLSLQTFTLIVRSSYSYFAVLQRMYQPHD